ncbi:STAS/SEC14 domain-containing protein [Salegentibacter sp. F188]|uniref:STAS/SEC14 domain-containing protein n=1 Tax=Autumnicola patrickiae TaxID=3075591 RepID=A0ABU3E6U8_9FLAO|nr:STAS/SEC14 domain-containing protein [Salegentibacter sp. F188]MDT0691713.1 STAS/SEC14 domain-containing protein [Salegentibacter sp. F188]
MTEADWVRVIPALQERIKQSGKIRWYFKMQDFRQDSTKTTWEDAGLHQFQDAFERIAVVGSKELHGWMRDRMPPLFTAEIGFFESIFQEEAHKWIRS